MNETSIVQGIIFDAYGTLFDVYAIQVRAEDLYPGQGFAIASLWRDKQIEYTRLRTLCDHYATFWQVTGDALDFALESLTGKVDQEHREVLLTGYTALPPHPEVPEVLEQLSAAGYNLAILTNADPDMLARAASTSKIDRYFSRMLSADSVRKFKTARETYRLGTDAFGCRASDLLFVSSNGWDIAGAAWFGYRTFWVNRSNAPVERLGKGADNVGSSLQDLSATITTLRSVNAA